MISCTTNDLCEKSIETSYDKDPLQLFSRPRYLTLGTKLVWAHGQFHRFRCSEPRGSIDELLRRFGYREVASLGAYLCFGRVFSSVAMTASPSLGVSGHQIEPKPTETCSILTTSTSKTEGIAIAGLGLM